MTRHERLNALLELVLQQRTVRIDEVVEALGVSLATARRDLDVLAEQQLVTRTRGGAAALPGSADLPLRYKSVRHPDEKRRIASAAAGLIGQGEVVGLNGGTTTTEVARELAVAPALQSGPGERSLVVVTNAVNIANELTIRPHIEVMVTGGVARTRSYELTGRLAELMLAEIRIDTLFLGVDAIDPEFGAATHSDREAAINALFVARASRVVVVADASKIGRSALARICPMQKVDTLITDGRLRAATLRALEATGVDVVQV